MDKNDAGILFDFLSDILFEEKETKLELSCLSEHARDLGEGMNFLSECISQLRGYAIGLARGELEMPAPPKDNHLVWPLKGLQSNLQHLTWQTQQVAKGDYNQHIEFLGDFSTAFNQMIEQLAQREVSLRSEMEKVSKKVSALERSRRLFQSLAENLPMCIVILERQNGKLLFENEICRRISKEEPAVASEVMHVLKVFHFTGDEQNWEYKCAAGDSEQMSRCYQIDSFRIEWEEQDAIVHILYDVTEQYAHDQLLESFAYQDPATGLFNRRYCMDKLNQYEIEKLQFSLCFLDLDHLKHVNDEYGHNEGDYYINTLARLLLGSLRQCDSICRIGGDEFVVLMPHCPENKAEDRMKWLRQAFANTRGDKPYGFSFSYGVMTVEQDKTFEPKSLLEEADAKMYTFKKAHRDGQIYK